LTTVRFPKNLIFLLFFLSGFTGLVYEIAWSRILSTILGNTSLAISIVVSIFLGGLAIGSFWSGRSQRLQRNPLYVYAALELFVAVYSAATPWMSGWIEWLYSYGYATVGENFWVSVLLKAFITSAFFMLPAVAMGATLPVLVRLFNKEERRKNASLLYGVNTGGAVLGTLLSGYVLLPGLGITRTILTTAAINVLIALGALFMARKSETTNEDLAHSAGFRPVYLLFFMTGFATLCYEILWTRALAMFFGSSVYAFSSILAAFLLGIAGGSSYYSKRIPEGADPYQFFSLIQFRISLAAIFFLGVFMGIPFLLIRLYSAFHLSFVLFQAAQFLLIGVIVFYATFLSGAAFPAALHFFRDRPEEIQSQVGNIYSYNTIGSILGAICAGFVLIPMIGVERSIRLIGLVNLILGIYCFRRTRPEHQDKKVLAIGGACLVLLLFLPQWNQSIYNAGFYAFAYKYVPVQKSEIKTFETPVLQAGLFAAPVSPEDLTLIYYGEGITATVAVTEQENGIRSLLVNGKPDASNVPTGDMRTQLLLGHLPVLIKGGAESVLVIGLGSGVTSGALAAHQIPRIDCVEIEGKVAEASRFFEKENLGILKRKNFRLILDDGRNFVQHDPGKYDIITSEPSNLWMSGVANLFTREFFIAAKKKLKPDGMMCQWIHLYQISLQDVAVFLKTYQSVFPSLSIWIDDSDMLVLGSDRPMPVDFSTLTRRMSEPGVSWSLSRSGLTPHLLMTKYAGNEAIVRVIRSDLPLNTDDFPVLEFSAPRSLFLNDSESIARSLVAFQHIAEAN